MKFSQLVVLLPCTGIEDFSLDRQPDDAQQILEGYCGLWHPVLLHATGDVPSWCSAEDPPHDPAGHVVVIPDSSESQLPHEWITDAQEAGALVLQGFRRREELLPPIFAALDEQPPALDPEAVADFHALGLCHLFVELLTRQLRYMSNLDEESFRREATAAAEAAFEGDAETTQARIQAAYDLLNEAREYFYPVEAHLLDLTLVAPTTLGAGLRAELSDELPRNLLISADTVDEAAREHPDTLDALRAALDKGATSLVGGEFDETELPLLPPEAVRLRLLRGLDAYNQHLGHRPEVFGRRRFGLSPTLPQILRQAGFRAAMHFTLDDGRFPSGNQSRVQWHGLGDLVIEAVGRIPIDVSRPDSFLHLAERLGDAMDLDHVATAVLAHWSGQSSPWYDDLRRITQFTSVLGSFASIDKYFEETEYSGQQVTYTADQYRVPYLVQEVGEGRADPISRWARYYRRRAACEAAQTLGTLAALLSGDRSSAARRSAVLTRLLEDVEQSLDRSEDGAELAPRLAEQVDTAVAALADATGGTDAAEPGGRLVFNPGSFPRRVRVELPAGDELPAMDGAIRSVEQSNEAAAAVVDVPPMGFAWVGPGQKTQDQAASKKRARSWFRRRVKPLPPMAELGEDGPLLRNEFFEIALDPVLGSIRTVSDYKSRRPRLAQQLALRSAQPGSQEPGSDANYSIMAAEDIAVTSTGPLVGELTVSGRLVDRQGNRVAGFRQATRVERGSRIIQLAIDLEIDRQPEPDPWHSYYASRLAWSDETVDVLRSVGLANVSTDAVQLEAPHFVDLQSGNRRTTLLCGGLPYHRRFGLRKLDTLLVVGGETSRSFRLGIGIDLPHPVPAALDFLAPETIASGVARPPIASGWLFHLDSRHVTATHWEPLKAGDGSPPPSELPDRPPEQQETPASGAGYRVRLLETDGRQVDVGLRSFRNLGSARKLAPGDSPGVELAVKGDRVTVPLGPHEWAEVEVRFS